MDRYLYFFESFEVVLKKEIANLMISSKSATVGLLKEKVI